MTRPAVGLRAFGSGARLDAGPAGGFSGTFDFKWPLGSRIRVAFQQPSFADLGVACAARAVIEEVALSWLGGANLALDFALHRDRFFPLPPFAPEPIQYEVLVSLDDLPVLLPAKSGQPREELVALPSSMLGTYALRMDYGDPTVYLGYRPEGTRAQLARERTAYFESAQFRGAVAHEFGHALGVAHEHQNPRRYAPGRPELWPPWASVQQIGALVERRWGVRVDGAFLRAELIDPWPCQRDAAGEPLYSDWRLPDAGWEFDSVMVIPGYQEFFRAPHARREDPRAWLQRHPTPTASDRAFLQRMYPAPRSG